MSMFCYQCQETAKNTACTMRGVCGKPDTTSNLQDLLVHNLIGLALHAEQVDGAVEQKYGDFICQALFATITNANFDDEAIKALNQKALGYLDEVRAKLDENQIVLEQKTVLWKAVGQSDFTVPDASVGVNAFDVDEDARSLKSLILYGLKGAAAYTEHAAVLGYHDESIHQFMIKGLAAIGKKLPAKDLTNLVLETGATAAKAMALLDRANTSSYGNPEISEVNIGVGTNPGILISGHDLKDMEELLEQTAGTGVDVYTHSEMLPANYYPAFKKYDHFVGNYGNAWWKQAEEFESFNGPILMTTNCIVPVKNSYKDRIFTTGMAGYPGVAHIPERPRGGKKDFSKLIELAKTCAPPVELEQGTIVGGFAHAQVLALADQVVDAVKSGAIRKFVVMAGCDGRHKSRDYFTEVAKSLPHDTVILTAGCAKYRYNKLPLGDIGGIPRVLDAGQCNDSYSLALIALKLKEVFGLEDVNDLPLDFDIAWYEQKAVAVLLALLHLGFRNIRLGPTLPAFLSPGVAQVLVDSFGIKATADVESDVAAISA